MVPTLSAGQLKLAVQALPAGQVPHNPPQPLSPHCLPAHSGTHSPSHVPSAAQLIPAEQSPQLPPQPSSPHSLLVQSGVQVRFI
jgi:hypothetical protein